MSSGDLRNGYDSFASNSRRNRSGSRRRSFPHNQSNGYQRRPSNHAGGPPPAASDGQAMRRPSAPQALQCQKPPAAPQFNNFNGREVRRRPASRYQSRESSIDKESSHMDNDGVPNGILVTITNGVDQSSVCEEISSRLQSSSSSFNSSSDKNSIISTNRTSFSNHSRHNSCDDGLGKINSNSSGDLVGGTDPTRRGGESYGTEAAKRRQAAARRKERHSMDRPPYVAEEITRKMSVPDLSSHAKTSGERIHYDRDFLLGLQFSEESLIKPPGLPPLLEVTLNQIKAEIQYYKEIRKELSNQCITSNRSSNQPSRPRRNSNSRGSVDYGPAKAKVGHSRSMSALTSPRPQTAHPTPQPANTGTLGRSNQRITSANSMSRAENRKVINVALSRSVQLHTADNAWKPQRKASSSEDNEKVFRTLRSILNKLTPQNFDKLTHQVNDLPINTETKLSGVIDILFEKAISEPGFSVAYAEMAKCLLMITVPLDSNPNEMITFRKILLNRCQREFERDVIVEIDLEKMQREIDEADTEEKKNLLIAEKEMAEFNARRRSLGNVRFIGELFKLKLLTEAIMNDCIYRLLKASDEDSIECLCRLLTTIGKDIDRPNTQVHIGQHFQKLQGILDNVKISSRLKFMIQDVLELRKNVWVPRHESNKPKMISEIHKEAEREKEEHQKLLQQLKTEKQNQPIISRVTSVTGMMNGHEESPWNGLDRRLTPGVKMWNGGRAPSTDREIPYHGSCFSDTRDQRGGDYMRGVAAYRQGQGREQRALSRDWKGEGQMRGQSRDGRPEMRDMKDYRSLRHTSRDSREEFMDWRSSGQESGLRSRGQSKGGEYKQGGGSRAGSRDPEEGRRYSIPPQHLAGKTLAMQSMEQDRNDALAAVRMITGASANVESPPTELRPAYLRGSNKITTGNTPKNSTNSNNNNNNNAPLSPKDNPITQNGISEGKGSTDNNANTEIAGSSVDDVDKVKSSQKAEPVEDAVVTDTVKLVESSVDEQPELSEECMESKNRAIMEEFLNIRDYKEAEMCVRELRSIRHRVKFVSDAVLYCLEQSTQQQEETGRLLRHLVNTSAILFSQYIEGMKEVLSLAEDLEIDIPKIWLYLGELCGAMIHQDFTDLHFLRSLCEPISHHGTKAGQLVGHTLHTASRRLGTEVMGEMWRSSGLEWSEFLEESQVKQFLQRNDLEFTNPIQQTSETSGEYLTAELDSQLITAKLSNQQVNTWIKENLSDSMRKESSFLRALMTSVSRSVMETVHGNKGSMYKVNTDQLKDRCELLIDYVSGSMEAELNALHSLQAFIHSLEHPQDLLRTFFDTLHDEEVISEEAFLQWYHQDDPAEMLGKGIAKCSVTQFFVWLEGEGTQQQPQDDSADSAEM